MYGKKMRRTTAVKDCKYEDLCYETPDSGVKLGYERIRTT